MQLIVWLCLVVTAYIIFRYLTTEINRIFILLEINEDTSRSSLESMHGLKDEVGYLRAQVKTLENIKNISEPGLLKSIAHPQRYNNERYNNEHMGYNPYTKGHSWYGTNN